MKTMRVNVYKATFDLIVEEHVQVEHTPCEEQLLVANNLEEAYAMAKAIKSDLRWGAVHKHTEVRDITLQHVGVLIRAEPWKEQNDV